MNLLTIKALGKILLLNALNCFLKKCCGIKDNTIILHIFFNMNKNAIMSRFIEYSNNIFFDVMLTVWRNVERRDKM